jgi:hypothetical protein
MAETSVPSLGDLIGLLGGANPLASIGKTIEQFRRGVNDFLAAVENFNRTMETVNDIATRANALFDEIEEPLKAFMPQVTRSVKAADAVINQISGPIEKVAPGISRLAETLSNPVFASMPNEISNFLDTFGDVARRLQPLAQMADSAGSMFGLRSFLGGGSSTPATSGRGRGHDRVPHHGRECPRRRSSAGTPCCEEGPGSQEGGLAEESGGREEGTRSQEGTRQAFRRPLTRKRSLPARRPSVHSPP